MDAAFADWIDKFTRPIVEDAVQAVAAKRHRDLVAGAKHLANVRDIAAYAAVESEEQREPGMRNCYLVRGRMRDKYFGDDAEMLAAVVAAMRRGMSGDAMHAAVDDNETLEGCYTDLGAEVSPLAALVAAMRTQSERVFIRETDAEWPHWQAYLRKTFGRGSPMNRDFGWFFPTRLPPDEASSRGRA